MNSVFKLHTFGWPLVFLIAAIPLVLWVLAGGGVTARLFSDGEFDLFVTLTSIGQVLGLAGIALFSFNFVLGARLKFIEGLFGGMNKVYIAHHIIGGLAFIFLLLHPLVLVASFAAPLGLAGVKSAFLGFVFNSTCFAGGSYISAECSVSWGILALLTMIFVLYVTFFVWWPYPAWKLTHQFMGLAFFFAALHVLFIPSDITEYAPLKYYIFVWVTVGFLAIFYRTFRAFAFLVRREFVVEEVRSINRNISEVILRPKDGKKGFVYQPGQFIFIGFPDHDGLGEIHPFSLSSDPRTDQITIGVKSLGDFTAKIPELKRGDRALVEGPFGRASYRYFPTKEQVWIAGGIGITPFLGMARSLRPEDGYKIDLYYSAATPEDAAFDQELRNIALSNRNFRLIPWYGKEKGFLDASAVIKESGGVLGKEIFVCGPPPMMKALKEQFAKWKIPSSTIHSEEFALM